MQKDRVRQRRFERRSTPWKGAILTTRRLAHEVEVKTLYSYNHWH